MRNKPRNTMLVSILTSLALQLHTPDFNFRLLEKTEVAPPLMALDCLTDFNQRMLEKP